MSDPSSRGGAAAPVGTEDLLTRVWDTRPGVLGWLGAVNHKQVGVRYIVTALLFFSVGGVQALLMRIQLGTPENTFLSPQVYNELFTLHGTTMMFLFAVPITEAVAIYLAPLMIGARDMPYPRLNAFGYWAYLLGGIFLYASYFPGDVPDGGWFAYVPLTGPEFRPGLNLDFWLLGVTFVEIAGVVAAIEIVALVLKCRAPGMALSRMPLFVWSSFVTAVMVLFAFPPLIAGSLMLELDRKLGTAFYDPAGGGDPVLWQHIFWWFGHPEVYIILLPAIGMLAMIIPTFARHRIVGYAWLVSATVAIGIVSFGLWVHHMYATGLPLLALSFFAAGSLLIAIPSGVQVFAWIATIWVGRPEWKLPMLWVVAAITTFVLGGMTGVMVAVVPFDWQAHDTFFVVAHFHYVIIGGVVFPLMAGLYYWVPKISGRMPMYRAGLWAFWINIVGFHATFFPQHIVGLLGMPRRVYTFLGGLGWDAYNLVSTAGALVTGLGFALALGAAAWGARKGEVAGPNPYGAGTLEWATSSPPPGYNFRLLQWPRSTDPLWDPEPVDRVPHDLAGEDGDAAARYEAWTQEFANPSVPRREILLTTVLDAAPEQIVTLPAHSLWPVGLAVTVAGLLLGVLVDSLTLTIVGTVASVVCMLGWGYDRQDGIPEEMLWS